MDEEKKRGRPRKIVEPEREATGMARVVVMHKTNIVLSVGKIPFRGVVEIPEDEFETICAGDDAAGRPHRLLRVDGK